MQAVRDKPEPFRATASLLREYPISSAEGLALTRLAEALLRVPDAETTIALTADQFGNADSDSKGREWRPHPPLERRRWSPATRSRPSRRPRSRSASSRC